MASVKSFNRFGKSGAYTCGCCGKLTRDTGRGEAEVSLCAECLLVNYVENAAADYGADSEQCAAAMRELLAYQDSKRK